MAGLKQGLWNGKRGTRADVLEAGCMVKVCVGLRLTPRSLL